MTKLFTNLSPRALAGFVFLLILSSSSLSLAYLYRQAVKHQNEMLQLHVEDLAESVAASVDRERHELLTDPEQQGDKLYQELLAPLKALHLRHPFVVYAYTMRVTDEGRELVILDTTTDPEVLAFEKANGLSPVPSPLLEEYRSPPGQDSADARLRSGEPYVFAVPYTDEFGVFINARHPLFDENGRYLGYAGVHFSLDNFNERLNEVRLAGLVAWGLAIAIGLIVARVAATFRREALANLERIKAAEANMREQRDRADQANSVKSEVLAIASHDLKNPLSAIAGISGLLLRRKRKLAEDDQGRADIDSLKSIHDSSEHMTAIIKGLLLNEGLESGKMTINREEVDLNRLVSDVVKANRPNAERKNIELEIKSAETFSTEADHQLLKECFDNYVNNALKYSPAETRVIVSLQSRGDQVEFSVEDEGPGLSQDDQAKLFGKFQKLTARPTGGENSTGLGLSIVKTIAELHGGEVGCESKLGQGARFWIRLPSPTPDGAKS